MSARRVAARVASALVVALLLAGCDGGPETPPLRLGQPAPPFELAGLAGERHTLDSLRGRPALISFWATWCIPCKEDMPILTALQRDGVAAVLAVALADRDRQAIAPFVAAEGITYPVALGGEEIFRLYQGSVIPHTVLLDVTTKVVAIYRGPLEEAKLRADIAVLAAGGQVAPAGAPATVD